jgi:hypothetical protein
MNYKSYTKVYRPNLTLCFGFSLGGYVWLEGVYSEGRVLGAMSARGYQAYVFGGRPA